MKTEMKPKISSSVQFILAETFSEEPNKLEDSLVTVRIKETPRVMKEREKIEKLKTVSNIALVTLGASMLFLAGSFYATVKAQTHYKRNYPEEDFEMEMYLPEQKNIPEIITLLETKLPKVRKEHENVTTLEHELLNKAFEIEQAK